ncbi:MAG: recombinase family protein [Alphaproteobacteria bacterium]|nr:MAG: recombinase family protein [Alphaproteobacteria bacterium]
MKIGYARVSAKWYQSELQVIELENQGCDKIWRENLSTDENSEGRLMAFLDQISPGDTVVATRVASVAHSPAELLFLLEEIQDRGGYFRSLTEPWADTRGPSGHLVINTLRGVIDFELTLAGFKNRDEADRPHSFGVSPGRPRALTERQKYEAMVQLKIGKSAAEIGRMLGVSRSTISRLKTLLR